MKGQQQAVRKTMLPGILSALAVSVVTAWRGRAETGSAIAAVNAPSHVLWGEQAANMDHINVSHTIPGVVINTGASIFWAGVMETLFSKTIDRQGFPGALAAGAVVSGLAYVTDYHVVPRRLTPGWEHRMSDQSLFLVYSTLALSLSAGALLARRASIRH